MAPRAYDGASTSVLHGCAGPAGAPHNPLTRGMILTVTLNLALDLTYRVPRVEWHGANRVSAVAQRAGGKGVNVARVLSALGVESMVTGLAGGPTGDAVRADLAAADLVDATVPIAGETRR